MTSTRRPACSRAAQAADTAGAFARAATTRAAALTGPQIDAQGLCERLRSSPEARAASSSSATWSASRRGPGRWAAEKALRAAEVVRRSRPAQAPRGLPMRRRSTRTLSLAGGVDDARIRAIGRQTIEGFGVNSSELFDDGAAQTRQFARQFAKQELLREEDGEAIADRVHREDLLVPERWIKQFSELGFFGSSVPDTYGGTEMGYLTMCDGGAVAAPLIAAAHARRRSWRRYRGGTEEQATWLPKLASGEVLVGIAVTEPDIGSTPRRCSVRRHRVSAAVSGAGCSTGEGLAYVCRARERARAARPDGSRSC
jgi:hypothetical protein